jgi:hypothetical protein
MVARIIVIGFARHDYFRVAEPIMDAPESSPVSSDKEK